MAAGYSYIPTLFLKILFSQSLTADFSKKNSIQKNYYAYGTHS